MALIRAGRRRVKWWWIFPPVTSATAFKARAWNFDTGWERSVGRRDCSTSFDLSTYTMYRVYLGCI